MWANENWSRRWDGSDDEVLIRQDYRDEDEAALVAAWVRHMADPRYIRIGGRPVLMVYRAELIPDAARTVRRWRQRLASSLGTTPLLVMAQSFGATDPIALGFDAAVEFPPHKTCDALPAINPALDILDTEFSGRVHDYAAAAAAALAEPPSPFPVIRTVVPSWDNDARRQGAGIVLHGATPALYEDWLGRTIARARAEPVEGEAVVCINAWNEWAEGAHLEPDQHWGSAFLNATGRAVVATSARDETAAILLVGHDALRHGAQLLLLAIGRRLRTNHGVRLAILLGAGGPLVPAFEALGPTVVASLGDDLDPALDRLGPVAAAIVNSLASGASVPPLRARAVPVLLLAHEMPRLLREKNLLGAAAAALGGADRIVVAADAVAEALDTLGVPISGGAVPAGGRAPLGGRALVLPQGIARAPVFSAASREAGRRALAIGGEATVGLGIGYADLRKGFDLFLAIFRMLARARPDIHFVWAGGIDPTVADYLAAEIEAATATGRFHMTGYLDRPDALYAAADCLLLPSREDPFPSVVLEAMAAGLPVVAFEGAGGIPALLGRRHAGLVVAPGDLAGFADAVGREAARGRSPRRRQADARRLGACLPCFDDYALALLRLAAGPRMLDVSVVVPGWNSAATIAERLASVFAQSHPVREAILLDDASADDTVARAEAEAAQAGRRLAIHRNATNSGSPFRQWREAVRRARGEWLWIAEADDTSDPRFLATLAGRLAEVPGAVLGFTDSRAVDAAGRPISESYRDYARASGCFALDADAVLDGPAFLRTCLAERNLMLNASAVLFRRDALADAFDRVEDTLGTLRVAGDWLLYATMLRAPGASVVYVASPLNVHRRHAASATARLPARRHLDEVAAVQDAIARDTDAIGPDDRTRQLRYRAALRTTLGLGSATRSARRR